MRKDTHGRNKVHRYYVHSSKKGDVINCSFKRIRADKIESKIVDYLSEILVLAGKALIKDLIFGIIVNPSNGLSIQFRLSGSLNSDATTPVVAIPEENQKNVIDFDNRGPQQQPPADAGTAEGGQSHNLGIFGSQVVDFGRGCAKVVEHQGLVIQREFAVLWKKPTLDLSLLAQLRSQGMGSRQICKLMGAPRTTVITAIHRMEKG